MTELISPCCGKPVTIVHDVHHVGDIYDYVTHWYECSACGKPCDPVDECVYKVRAALRSLAEPVSKDAKDEEKV